MAGLTLIIHKSPGLLSGFVAFFALQCPGGSQAVDLQGQYKGYFSLGSCAV